jgi:two-component system, chemotaxis family, protein-glutamate methylesterase/glutaminase
MHSSYIPDNAMPPHDLMVIGGSVGALEALQRLLPGLAPDFEAAICVVIHTAAESPGLLPDLLGRVANRPAKYPVDGETIQGGRIYVARPDHHLLIENGKLRLTRGPRENGFRPAVDPLFRTAAESYDGRTIGVILSGGRNDGTAGLGAIKDSGGVAIAQHPEDALAPSMPQSAIRHVDVDFVLKAADIPRVVANLPTKVRTRPAKPRQGRKRPDSAEVGSDALNAPKKPGGTPSAFVCPECGGTLWEAKQGRLLRFRCHVGHAYTGETLVEEQQTTLEQALWNALRTLEESASLRERMADHARDNRMDAIARDYDEQKKSFEEQAAVIRRVLVVDKETPLEEAGPRRVAARARKARQG